MDATKPSTTAKEVAPFLKNLRKMLDNESDGIIRWTASGRAFEIHDMERMMEYVLPKYFKHRKYTSFQRQLNYFNFKKWTKSKAAVCTFSNDYFLRDQPDLAWRITRKKSTPTSPKTNTRKLSNASSQGSAASSPTATRTTEPVWKHEDMNIVVPAAKAPSYYHSDSFPSPTDMDMMPFESDTDGQRFYAQADDSLEWIDNFFPSLNVPKMDESFYYNTMPAAQTICHHHHQYPPMGYHSLPAPTGFGCV